MHFIYIYTYLIYTRHVHMLYTYILIIFTFNNTYIFTSMLTKLQTKFPQTAHFFLRQTKVLRTGRRSCGSKRLLGTGACGTSEILFEDKLLK